MDAARKRARQWLQPLRVHVSVVIVLLLVGVAAPLIWLSYESGRDAAAAAAANRMGVLADRIVDRYDALFTDARSKVGVIATAAAFLRPPAGDDHDSLAPLFKALDLSAYLDGIYVGYADGSFIHVVDLTNGPEWRKVLKAPQWAEYAVRATAAGDQETRWSVWRFLDRGLGKSATAGPALTSYDPRVRPWYRLAVQAAGTVITPPYVTATTRAYALTISESHRSDRHVVVGADVLLGRLSRFLAEERISGGSKSYVFDRNGRLIVHSDPDVMSTLLASLSRTAGFEAAVLPARDPLYEHVRGTVDRRGLEEERSEFEVDGSRYLLHVNRITDDALLGGTTIAVAAPLADFTAASERLLQTNLFASLALLALGVSAALLISRLLSQSLARLRDEADRMAAFDFTVPERLTTHITEVRSLDGAIDRARAAIRAFGLYVPQELVRRIVQSGQHDLHLAARQEVTVMFTDIKDFTTISERHTPEAVVAILSRYFELMNRGVESNGGTIVQFLGDSIYAMWNAPVADPDHAASACACALDLAAGLAEFNREQRRSGQPEIITRFGIHSGPAVVGSVGAEDRLQYTAMGDTVNVASRLEGSNKEFGTSILVSRGVRDRCGDRFVFRSLGFATVKGREEPVEVFELRGRHDEGHGREERQGSAAR